MKQATRTQIKHNKTLIDKIRYKVFLITIATDSSLDDISEMQTVHGNVEFKGKTKMLNQSTLFPRYDDEKKTRIAGISYSFNGNSGSSNGDLRPSSVPSRSSSRRRAGTGPGCGRRSSRRPAGPVSFPVGEHRKNPPVSNRSPFTPNGNAVAGGLHEKGTSFSF